MLLKLYHYLLILRRYDVVIQNKACHFICVPYHFVDQRNDQLWKAEE